jgi:hypothetical protein
MNRSRFSMQQTSPISRSLKTMQLSSRSSGYLTMHGTFTQLASQVAEELSPTSSVDLSSEEGVMTKQQIKGLEEIGAFAEFYHSKQVFDHNTIDKQFKRKSTIHITDFMKKDHKLQLLLGAGGWNAYLEKKQEFTRSGMNRENAFKRFFHHKEKHPAFFTTPPVTPKYVLGNDKLKFSKTPKPKIQLLKIEELMQRCDLALAIKPKPLIQKKSSPKLKLKKLIIHQV